MKNITKIKPNTLIAYEGGGYDGCIWEWNFALFDNNGEFNNLYSSGCNGCETRDEIIEFINDDHNIEYNNFDIIDISTDEKYQEFSGGSWMAAIILQITNMLNSGDYDLKNYDFTFKCDNCENETVDGIGVDPVGCGGIVIMNDGKVCEDCYCNNTCPYCGEYDGDHWENCNENGYCEYCTDEDPDSREFKCIKQDDYDELEVGKSYKVFRSDGNEYSKIPMTEITVINENKSIETYPVEYFQVPYELINPNQLNVFVDNEKLYGIVS